MTLPLHTYEKLHDLLGSLCDGAIDAERFQRLQQLLADDVEAQQFYIRYLDLHGVLRRLEQSERGSGFRVQGSDFSPDPSSLISHPSSVAIIRYPVSTTQPFVGSALFSYLVSAILLSLGLLIAAVAHVSQPTQFANLPLPASGRHHEVVEARGEGSLARDAARSAVVGQITGMFKCRVVGDSKTEDLIRKSEIRNPKSEAISKSASLQISKSPVSLGDKFNLISGLLEITYDTGAKVLLQGPVRYEVESPDGGYLSLGRLTAMVEASTEYGVLSTEQTASKDEIRNQKSETISRSPNLQTAKFVVRTPTATVTDLGTEFGVEVTQSGETTSHVFRGLVRVQRLAGGGAIAADGRIVRENQTVRVEGSPDNRQIVALRKSAASHFVRAIPLPRVKQLDLLDIVAGGRGISGRREHGIDASTGMQDPVFVTIERTGDGNYHPVDWHKLIDGTFVPNGKGGPMAIDSAGHRFDAFPPTSGSVWGSIWARPADLKPTDQRIKDGNYHLYRTSGEQYMPERRGLLCLHANAGVTLDLDAMRRTYPPMRPARFRAVAGLIEPRGLADLWVCVDGQLKLNRMKLRQKEGVVRVDIDLGPNDRFLTLAATDGGDGDVHDWVVFGDPILDMIPAEEDHQ